MKTRREFLKTTCTACLGTALLGLTASSCSSLPIYKTKLSQGNVFVPVSSFGESDLVIVRDLQVPFDILLVKKGSSEYVALYMKCSHQDNPVTATKDGLFCSAHGSTFDLSGAVTKEPAINPLKRFKTSVHDNQVLIEINS